MEVTLLTKQQRLESVESYRSKTDIDGSVSVTESSLVRGAGCNGCCAHTAPIAMTKTRHQSSIDSGMGALDTISEHREYTAVADAPFGKLENPKFSAKKTTTTCSCADHNSQHHPSDEYFQEQDRAIENGSCLFESRSKTCSCHGEIRNYAPQRERFRSKSGSSSCNEEVFLPHGRNSSVMRDDLENPSVKNGHKTLQKQRSKRCCLVKQILYVIAGLSLVTVICAAFYIMLDFQIKELNEKIAALEESIGGKKTTPSSFSEITSKESDDSRSRLHLVLKSRRSIPVNKWSARTLEWRPEIQDNGGLKYNEETKAVEVQEAGTYFVYDQIYVFRHLPDMKVGMNGLSNHTTFHVIYRRPFNFGTTRKPTVVTESALSNCWNANAKTQIHSSYQGVIVKLQKKEQLLVALEEYDESMDTLDAKSTFFGVFKL